jgi:CubicO group peptidase (beta-lactamase class C family)
MTSEPGTIEAGEALKDNGFAVAGDVAPGFEPVRTEFARLIEIEPDCAGQFCAYVGGRRVVDLWGGPDVGPDDLRGVFSSTKGVAGICMALLVQRRLLELDARVSRYWPEFAAGGKQGVTVRLALSHQAGLVGVEPQLSTLEEGFDHDLNAARLAAQVPQWHPGAACGYHSLTLGTIMDELGRRTTGLPLAQFFRQEIGIPCGIDFFVATTPEEEPRVKPLLPAEPTAEQLEVNASSPTEPDSLPGLAINAAGVRRNPSFDPSVPLPNRSLVRAAGQPAVSGVGSARGLARLYAISIGEVDGMEQILSAETMTSVSQIQAAGEDLVLGHSVRFAIVFQKPRRDYEFGSHLAFGHDGVGGSLGVADPWHHLAYAWIPRRMTFPGGYDPRGLAMAKIARQCAFDLAGA